MLDIDIAAIQVIEVQRPQMHYIADIEVVDPLFSLLDSQHRSDIELELRVFAQSVYFFFAVERYFEPVLQSKSVLEIFLAFFEVHERYLVKVVNDESELAQHL